MEEEAKAESEETSGEDFSRVMDQAREQVSPDHERRGAYSRADIDRL